MLGLPAEAASTLQSLLCLQLKLSYLSTKTPKALKEYTHSRVREAGMGIAWFLFELRHEGIVIDRPGRPFQLV